MTDKTSQLTEGDLAQFTGTTKWFKHPLFKKVVYTEGVQYLAQNAGAYWLISDILMYHSTNKDIQNQPFCVWTLKRNENDAGAILSCEDGNYNPVFSTKITFTDFPLKSITLWCCDNVLLLPSEY